MNINGIFPGKIFPDETICGSIDIFENVIPNPGEIIHLVEEECKNTESNVYWEKATTIGSGKNQNYRTNSHLGITSFAYEGNSLMQNIHNQFYFSLLAASIPYAEKHGIQNLFHEPYMMLKYRSGQSYGSHSDGGGLTNRCVSAIMYLNNEYDGGEIEFTNFKIKIKPEPGMMILFPSNYAYSHIAHPVTEGTKYAIVTWMKDVE